jgi:rhodanese-related sulfurtransferase
MEPPGPYEGGPGAQAYAVRVDGSSIDEVLAQSRRRLERVEPGQLAEEMAAGALVVDIRPVENREAEGLLPGAVVVDRNVLEWRLDPTCPDRIAEADDPERRVIVFCNEGYASSLAAETLQRVGLPRATDLVGGYRAWQAQAQDGAPDQPDERSAGTSGRNERPERASGTSGRSERVIGLDE